MTIAATGLVAWVFLFPTGNTISSMGVTFGGCSDECSSERAQEAAEEEVKDLRSTSSAALILDTSSLFGEQFVNCRPFRSHHDQVRMDFDEKDEKSQEGPV